MPAIALTDCTVRSGALTEGITEIVIETPATADNADTIAVTLASFGINVFLSARGYIQTTANSVIAVEDPTTAVSAGVLTLTIGGSTANKQRTYYVRGRGSK